MRKPIPLDLAAYKANQLENLIHAISDISHDEGVSPHLQALISIGHDLTAEINESLHSEVSHG